MLRNFNLPGWLDPRAPLGWLRLLAMVLLLANIAASYFLVRPVGGSPEELREQVSNLRSSLRLQRGGVDRTTALLNKVKTGRTEGEQFLGQYFLMRRTAYSTILAELVADARDSGIQARESTFTIEQVEGSDTLQFMKVTANYTGSYANLIQFVNRLDHSERLLIIEGLQATPQQQAQLLNVTVKLDAFVRDETGGAAAGGAP